MSQLEERRNPNVQRVDLTTLVDICIQDGTVSPFQAESANVSGRGMHVRTSHLPEIGEELVCRFEHGGKEILVEGRVAWRAEGSDSGEFGIQFTALDADSAEVLKSLRQEGNKVGPRRSSPLFSLEPEDEEEEAEDASEALMRGSKVRLHIDGLGAPMKACVHESGARKVRVGSSLEFLKVGRALRIEDVEVGQSRGAQIDAVNVVMNPSTAVPELVVMLRYEGVTPTPAPATFDAPRDARAVSAHQEEADVFEADEEEDPLLPDRLRPAADALRARLEGAFDSAAGAAKKAGGFFGDVTSRLTARARALGEERRTAKAPARAQAASAARRPETRRKTAPPPHLRSSLRDVDALRSSRASLRPTAESVRPPAPQASRARPWVAAGLLSAVVLGSALLLRGLGGEQSPAPEVAVSKAAAAPQSPSAAPPAPASTTPVSPDGIIADVPLFGPKAMATAEAASPAPGAAELDEAAAEKLAAAATMEDETFEDVAPPSKPEEVAPWGRGKLHLPTIHRIRLDGSGTELAGVVEPTGFTVVVPGRKAMESGRAIEKRDRRISGVKASNTARGASVKFEFRGPVPAYRVRLRKDFVEFLISAPEDGVAQR